MKKYTLLLSFFLINSWCFSQNKGDNVVIVKGVSFIQACTSLLDSGYLFKSKDSELQIVVSEPREYPKGWNAGYVIIARIKEGDLYLKVTFTAPFQDIFTRAANKTDPLWKDMPGYYRTNKKREFLAKSMDGQAFKILMDWARCFGKPIEYLKE